MGCAPHHPLELGDEVGEAAEADPHVLEVLAAVHHQEVGVVGVQRRLRELLDLQIGVVDNLVELRGCLIDQGVAVGDVSPGAETNGLQAAPHLGSVRHQELSLLDCLPDQLHAAGVGAACHHSASKNSIRRFVITEKAPTRAFSWLNESGYYRFHI